MAMQSCSVAVFLKLSISIVGRYSLTLLLGTVKVDLLLRMESV